MAELPLMTTSANSPITENQQVSQKRKRNHAGNPDPSAEVIALSPRTLMATNRFTCEVCNKGFQRDQNLQLHRRGHNLPWKLKQRPPGSKGRKRVYVCPEPTCVHHNPSRALGDLTGIKKHYSRKHGEKKWKCHLCRKKYAVQSDYIAHSKICGKREYVCDCGTNFNRRDSYMTHRAFCNALAPRENPVDRLTRQSSTIANGVNLNANGNGNASGSGDHEIDLNVDSGMNLNLLEHHQHYGEQTAAVPQQMYQGMNLEVGQAPALPQQQSAIPLWLKRGYILNSLEEGMSPNSKLTMTEILQLADSCDVNKGIDNLQVGAALLHSLQPSNNSKLPIMNHSVASQMPATALLLQATQMGATVSSTSGSAPSFLGQVMTRNSQGAPVENNGKNELTNLLLSLEKQAPGNFQALMRSRSRLTEPNNVRNLMEMPLQLLTNHSMVPPPSPLMPVPQYQHSSSATRDFLGISVGVPGSSSSSNANLHEDLAKFVSMATVGASGVDLMNSSCNATVVPQ